MSKNTDKYEVATMDVSCSVGPVDDVLHVEALPTALIVCVYRRESEGPDVHLDRDGAQRLRDFLTSWLEG